jgi:hypothetical protein
LESVLGATPQEFESPILRQQTWLASASQQATVQHALTPDSFEAARIRLAYGERLRRARNRVLAREQLRAAAKVFERLGARPWAAPHPALGLSPKPGA